MVLPDMSKIFNKIVVTEQSSARLSMRRNGRMQALIANPSARRRGPPG